jgi:hypothetical protein
MPRTALAVQERNMRTLFRAVIGFGIAFYAWPPATFPIHFDTSAAASLRSEIEAAHPHTKLLAQFEALKR